MLSNHRSLFFSFLVITVVSIGAAAAERAVQLDDGRELRGTIREVTAQRLLIQTDTTMFEVSADHVHLVDGSPLTPAMLATRDRLIVSTHYVTVQEDGAVELLTRNRTVNRGADVITSLSWGAAEHELEMVRTMEVFDGFGNQLDYRLEPPTEERAHHMVVVDLELPVPPGELVSLALRYQLKDAARRSEIGFALTFPGDFPDDRLYTRVVRLPAGAEVLDVTPEPMKRFDHDGAPHVVWRRYYPAGLREDLTVTYRLASPGTEGSR